MYLSFLLAVVKSEIIPGIVPEDEDSGKMMSFYR